MPGLLNCPPVKEYSCSYLEGTPLTAEEIQTVKETLADESQQLATIYKVHTAEEIEQRLFGEWGEGNKSEKSESSHSKDDSIEDIFDKNVETDGPSIMGDDEIF